MAHNRELDTINTWDSDLTHEQHEMCRQKEDVEERKK